VNSVRSGISAFTNGVTDVAGTRGDLAITPNSRSLSIVPIPNRCNYSVYVKIGLKMSCNISFQNFSVVANSNPLPPAPVNVTLSVSGTTGNEIMSLTWNTPTACNPPLDRYNFSIIPAVATISGIQYPRRCNASVIQEPYFLNVNCNLFGQPSQTSFSFSNIASNYDTPYYGTVALANDSGLGADSSNAYRITSLPPNNGLEFTATPLRPSGTAVNYNHGGISFANRSGGSIANTLIYASNLLFTNGSSRDFITNSNITINPSSDKIGNLMGVTWQLNILNVTSDTILKNQF
jgi:hypothetical protein